MGRETVNGTSRTRASIVCFPHPWLTGLPLSTSSSGKAEGRRSEDPSREDRRCLPLIVMYHNDLDKKPAAMTRTA